VSFKQLIGPKKKDKVDGCAGLGKDRSDKGENAEELRRKERRPIELYGGHTKREGHQHSKNRIPKINPRLKLSRRVEQLLEKAERGKNEEGRTGKPTIRGRGEGRRE